MGLSSSSAHNNDCLSRLSGEEERELLHLRKKRPSDLSIHTILHDPLVSNVFNNFMFAKFSEEILQVWMDLYSYEKIPYEAPAKVSRASMLYHKYFSEHPLLGFFAETYLDTGTIQTLRHELLVNQADEVTQRDPEALSEVFRLVYGKVVTLLKFDFMPQFLVSDHFQNLEAEMIKLIEEPLESLQKVSESLECVSIQQIIGNPLLLNSFLEFVRLEKRNMLIHDRIEQRESLWSRCSLKRLATSSGSPKWNWRHRNLSEDDVESLRSMSTKEDKPNTRNTLECTEDLVDLYQEIEDYRQSKSIKHQFERMKRIFTRYGNGVDVSIRLQPIMPPIKYLEEHCNNFERKVGTYRNIVYQERDVDFFNPAQEELLERLQQFIVPLYLESPCFQNVKSNMTQTITNLKRSRMHSNVRKLSKFAQDRCLFDNFATKYTFESALALPWGEFYIKRFARKRLQEESVLFLIEVREFRKVFASDSIEVDRRTRAWRIYNMFIDVDGDFPVNISSLQRENVHSNLETNRISATLFDETYTEILKMLEMNLWIQFQQDNAHENFRKKVCTRNCPPPAAEQPQDMQTDWRKSSPPVVPEPAKTMVAKRISNRSVCLVARLRRALSNDDTQVTKAKALEAKTVSCQDVNVTFVAENV